VDDLNTIRIDLNSKTGRDVVERLIRGAGAPGALVGFAKDGSAALVFRSTRPHDTVPFGIGGASHNQRVFELASRDGTTRITISTDSAAQRDGWKWDRDVALHDLRLTSYTAADVGERLIRAAFGLDFDWTESVIRELEVARRVEQFKRDVADGRVKLRTPEEIAADDEARRDEEIVAANAGRELSWFDGNVAQLVLAARGRHAERQRKQAAVA
jgi:hypothetical protein